MCFVCLEPIQAGDPVYWSEDGYMHAGCCGPERECFFNADEAPLSEGEPVPRPLIWTNNERRAMQLCDDAVNDVVCVDRFASLMKAKLAQKRAEGYGGWDDPSRCTTAHLSQLLIKHVAKGDPLDVANFAMMLHQRGARIDANEPQDPVE